jgi:hypothetical protein
VRILAHPLAVAALAAASALVVPRPVRAGDTLDVVPTSSTLAVTGSLVGTPFQPQGPGSLTSTYSGAIGIAALNLPAATLTFDSTATAIAAAVSGNWMPRANGADGSEPANYGGQVTVSIVFQPTTVRAAIRDAVVTIGGSPTVSLTQTGPGTFTFPANQPLTFLSGSLDYRDTAGRVPPGRNALAGQSATNNSSVAATFQNLGGDVYGLSYPVDVTVNSTLVPGVVATFRIQGTITAQGVIAPVPEPFLTLTVSLGACGAWAAWRRGRARRSAGRDG